MRSQSIPGLVLALTLVVALSVHAQQSAGQLFQSGLYREEVDGDLEGAIEIYRKVVEAYPEDRPVAAKAWLHIGLCYEKLGRAEAQKAYERLLREFGDQAEVVAEARARLAALGKPLGMAMRPVWAPADDTSGMPSPDGRYLSFAEWKTANLAVRDLTTGEIRLLTDEGTWMSPDQYAFYSIWSPDGRQIAYAWFNRDLFELRLVGLDGPGLRVLYRDEDVKIVQPFAWSGDGRYILAWLSRTWDSPGRIGLISAADGSVRVLKSGVRLPIKVDLSPDGRTAIYDRTADSDSSQSDLFLLPTDGGREVPLMAHPADDYGAVWTPDGKHVVFVSDRTGRPAAWALEVVDGRPRGAPRMIVQNMERVVPMGFIRDGSFYYALKTLTAPPLGDVYTAALDPVTGEVLTPKKVPQRFEGANAFPNWSSDGKRLAYLSVRGLRDGRAGFCVIVIRDIETGDVRELPLKHKARIRWSPDGRSILLIDRGLSLIDIQTGDITPVMRGRPEIEIFQAAWSPDGRRIFSLRHHIARTEYTWRIVVRDLETGKEVELRRGDVEMGFALSPDGRQLAFAGERALRVMPTAGGEAREVLGLPPSEVFPHRVGPVWTPDGRHIFVGKGKSLYPDDPEASARQLFEVWRVPAEGGEPQKLGFSMKRFHDFSIHPNGRQIAFTRPGSRRQHAEVWAVENLLSGFEAASDR